MLNTPYVRQKIYKRKNILDNNKFFLHFPGQTEDQNAILVASFSLGLLGLLVTLLVSIALA